MNQSEMKRSGANVKIHNCHRSFKSMYPRMCREENTVTIYGIIRQRGELWHYLSVSSSF